MKKTKNIAKRLPNRFVLGAIVILLSVIALSVSIALQKTNTKSQAAPAGFVTREGKNLLLNGSAYKFVGFNAYGMTGCYPRAWTQEELDAYFQSIPPASMTRTWAFEKQKDNLDLVVTRAEANGQKIVMSLGNGLHNCEELGDDGAGRGAEWFQSGYKGAYLEWVKTTVAKYKDSPAVGMWEISNEGGHPDNIDVSIMKPYYDDVAAVIKGIDANHLVSTGALAEYTYGGTANYEAIHSSPNIDVISFHEYDGTGISDHFGAVQTVSNDLNKPIMVGETGVNDCEPDRANILKAKFDGYLAGGASGVLLWNRDLTGDSCGFGAIGPEDETSTMVKNYVIPGIQLTGAANPTTMATPTSVSPTFVCEGACPTGESTPTVNPAEPTESDVEPTTPSDVEPTDPTDAEPTAIDAEPTTPDNQPNTPRGNRGNGIWGFFMWLISLLMQLFQRLFQQ